MIATCAWARQTRMLDFRHFFTTKKMFFKLANLLSRSRRNSFNFEDAYYQLNNFCGSSNKATNAECPLSADMSNF